MFSLLRLLRCNSESCQAVNDGTTHLHIGLKSVTSIALAKKSLARREASNGLSPLAVNSLGVQAEDGSYLSAVRLIGNCTSAKEGGLFRIIFVPVPVSSLSEDFGMRSTFLSAPRAQDVHLLNHPLEIIKTATALKH
jgi:hypothetical protein